MNALINTKQSTAEKFSKAAKNYERHAKVQRKAADLLLDRLNECPGVLLDLGAGPLVNSQSLNKKCRQLVAVDLSTEMLKAGAAHIPKICADMDHLPFAANSLDCVFSNFAIQWSTQPGKLFTDLFACCKSNSQVLISTVLDGSLVEMEIAWQDLDSHPHINQFLTLEQLADYAELAGFKVVYKEQVKLLDVYDSAKEALQSVKNIGANNKQTKPETTGLLGKTRYTQVLNQYPLKGLCAPVTYQVAILELTKP